MQNNPLIRVAGILLDDNAILLEKQVLEERSHWTLPGGRLEFGETLDQGLAREMREETGLEVEVGELLYVCDRFRSLNHHVLDISFLVRRVGGMMRSHSESDGGAEVIARIEMVPVDLLPRYGFSLKFVSLVQKGFPCKGSYQGEFHSFYG